jgi:BNR/Asp-box repeat protein
MAIVESEAECISPAQTTRLLIAMQDALLVADGHDDRFDAREELWGRNPQCLAADPGNTSRIYCGTAAHGLWASDDGGTSWRRLESLPAGQVTAVAVSPIERRNGYGVVYAGTEPSAVFWSDDGGATWHESRALATLPSASQWSFPPRPETHHVRWLCLDPVLRGRLFVAIEAGALVRSVDGGGTWIDRTPDGPYDTHALLTHPLAPGRLYSAAGDGYFESENGGASWRQPEEGLRHHYLWSVAVDTRDPDLVLVSAASGPRAAHSARAAESHVYRRIMPHAWLEALVGLPAPKGTTVGVITASPREPRVFYLVNNRGVYRSHDGGQSWQMLAIPWPVRFHLQRAVGLIVEHS